MPTARVGYYTGSGYQFFLDGSTQNTSHYLGLYFAGTTTSSTFYIAQTTGMYTLQVFGLSRR